jgi:CRISPR-associated endonuclease Cas1
MRLRHDTPDFDRARDALANGTFSSIHDAWREYVTQAARPYAYATYRRDFERYRAALARREWEEDRQENHGIRDIVPEFEARGDYWRRRAAPKSSVLFLYPRAGMRLRSGALEIDCGDRPEALGGKETLRFEPNETKRAQRLGAQSATPRAICFAERGGFITTDAISFCASNDIAVIVLGRPSTEIITIVAPTPRASAEIVRAQARATPVKIAREIIRHKIETCNDVLHVGVVTKAETVNASLWERYIRGAQECSASLDKAHSVDRILLIEAKHAEFYWALRWRDVASIGIWPKEWRHFNTRRTRILASGSRHADHPVNALLNWAYAVAAGRIAAELASHGACLSIGFLHSDLLDRHSLVFDALELLRPLIDERVMGFVAKTKFRAGDFGVDERGIIRVNREMLRAFGPEIIGGAKRGVGIPPVEFARAAEWTCKTILNNSGA